MSISERCDQHNNPIISQLLSYYKQNNNKYKKSKIMSYTQTSYHIILRTHCSIPAIVEDHERELYSYMLGFINNKGGRLYRIGGMPDHVHLFVSLPATLAMSKFVQELK